MSMSGNRPLTGLWMVSPKKASEMVAIALRHNEGDVRAAAKQLRVARTTLQEWIRNYPELKNVIEEFRPCGITVK